MGKKTGMAEVNIIGTGSILDKGEPVVKLVGFQSTPEEALRFQKEVEEELGEETALINLSTQRETRKQGQGKSVSMFGLTDYERIFGHSNFIN
jgi:hypothetical protein